MSAQQPDEAARVDWDELHRQDEKWKRIAERDRALREVGDCRDRCDEGHLICQGGHCGHSCACANHDDWEPDFPIRVTTDKRGRTYCRECRYEEDLLA